METTAAAAEAADTAAPQLSGETADVGTHGGVDEPCCRCDDRCRVAEPGEQRPRGRVDAQSVSTERQQSVEREERRPQNDARRTDRRQRALPSAALAIPRRRHLEGPRRQHCHTSGQPGRCRK